MFKEELELVPTKPGSYQMYDKNDIVIYVGKAKNLKRRLSSYFNRTQTGKTAELVKNIAYFKYIVTNTELESFILEINCFCLQLLLYTLPSTSIYNPFDLHL